MISTGTATEAVTGGRGFPPAWRSWLAWAIPATFYLAAFYLRSAPAVMTTELMRDFHIGAKSLGNLSACYFYAYVLMQIPTGILVDSWGAKRLLVSGSLLGAVGTVVFASTDNFVAACVSRALVGGATAVGWVITLKLATHWFPSKSFAMLSGLGLLVGNIGALFAQVPLRLLVESMGWRAVGLASAVVLLIIGAVAWISVRDDPSDIGFRSYAPAGLSALRNRSVRHLLNGFGNIFKYSNTWLIIFSQGGFVGSMLSFTGLWGPPYLRTRFELKPTAAAAVCSVMIICWAVASPIAGRLSDAIGRRKPIYLGGAVAAAAGWAILFYLPGLSLPGFLVIAALTSFSCGAVILGFAYAKESVPVKFLGTITGSINMGNMVGPMLLQPGIGWMLDRHWSGTLANGARAYSAQEYQWGFALIIAWMTLSCLLISITRETNCKPTAG
jgi:MFS family permease